MSNQLDENTMTAEQYQASLTEDSEWVEGPLKQILVDYVGKTSETEDITAEMIVEKMAEEFPEFVMAIAEENWIRGYQQAIHDVDKGQELLEQYAESENGTP